MTFQSIMNLVSLWALPFIILFTGSLRGYLDNQTHPEMLFYPYSGYTLENYKVLFSVRDGYGEPDESWHFAISNKDIAAQVKAGQPYVTIKQTVANMNDLQEILSVGGEVYIDESLVLNKENLLEFNKENITTVVNLGNAQLSTEGIMSNQVPINIKKGEVIINGGIIGALGSGVDLDGNSYSTPINSEDNTIVTINNTQFNGSGVSPIKFSGKATLNNVKLTGGNESDKNNFIYKVKNYN